MGTVEAMEDNLVATETGMYKIDFTSSGYSKRLKQIQIDRKDP